jgi:hypothetical protein
MVHATLYADLNCPHSYALTARLEVLGLMHRCDWRGVQHDPGLPVPARLGDRRVMRALEDDVDAVRRAARADAAPRRSRQSRASCWASPAAG